MAKGDKLVNSGGVGLGHSGDGIPEKISARTAVAAVAGGTASVLAGGKFANGAVTAAFATMFNDFAQQQGPLGTQSGQDENGYAERTRGNGHAQQVYVLEDIALLLYAPIRAAYAMGTAAVNLGSKLDFLFGLASGANAQRSTSMLRELRSIGIFDNPEMRSYVADHLRSVASNASSVVRTQTNGFTVRESLLMGPRGGVKLESVWDGKKLITTKVFK